MSKRHIERFDTLNQGREKINEAIDASFNAEVKSDDANRMSNIAKENSLSALDIANNTRDELKDIVIESGTSDAEVIAGRGNHDWMPDRLDANDKNTQVATETTVAKKRQAQTIVTFISDDGMRQEFELAQIFRDKNVKYTLAIPPNLAGSMSIDYLDDLKKFQDIDGFEIVSHTYDHVNLATLSDAEIEYQMTASKNWLRDNGFKGYDILVYPQGGNDERVRRIARKHYKCAIGTLPANGINSYPIKQFDISRVGLGSYFNTEIPDNADSRFPVDGSTLEYYKARVDYAIQNKQWLIFMLHPWHAQHNATQKQHIADLIDYIKQKGVKISSVSDALDIVGNAVDVGDYHYTQTTDFEVVGASGKAKSSQVINDSNNKIPVKNYVENHDFSVNGLMFYSANNQNVKIELSGTTRTGKKSLKLIRLNAASGFANHIIQDYLSLKNKIVELGAWVMCPIHNTGEMRLFVQDGIKFKNSETIPKDGNWHFIKIKFDVDPNAITLQLNLGRTLPTDILSVNDILYIDSLFLNETVLGVSQNKPTLLTSNLSTFDIDKGGFAYTKDFLYFASQDNTPKRLQLGNQTELYAVNSYTPTTPLSEFTPATIVVCAITTSFATSNDFPGKVAGIFTTYNYGLDNDFKYQTFETMTGVTYRRQFNSAGVASIWIATGSSTGSGRPVNPVKGQQHFDTSVNQQIFWTGVNWINGTGQNI